MTGGDEKRWKSQSERKAFFIELNKQKAANAAKNWSSYVPGYGPSLPTQPWPLPTHAYPQGTAQPTMQSQPPSLSQEQIINEFHRLHQFNSQQLQYNADQSVNHLRSLLTGQPVTPSQYMHPVNQMPNYPPQYQHHPAPGPFVPSNPAQYQHQTTVSPYVPFHTPRNMQQPYNVSQALGAFRNTPMSQYRQTPAPNNLFKPDSVRCQEVDDTSTSASSVVEPSETPVPSVHSPDGTIDKVRELDLKRKAETEKVETLKKTRVESNAEAESPTASNKEPTEIDTELDRPHEPQAYRNPVVRDASPNHHGQSQQSNERPTELTIGDANTPNKSKADAMPLDPSKTPPMTSHRTTFHQGTKSRITPGDLENSSTADFVDALETSSQASTICLSPELPYHPLPFKASKLVCKNEHPRGSLLHTSLDDLPDLDMPARDTAPPNSPRDSSFSHETPDAISKSLGNDEAKHQRIASHERLAAPGKRTFKMLLELESTLKVAQEVPMPRAKPKYDSFYHMALPDLEDGDVNAASCEDSEYMNDSGDDEDGGSVTLDNVAEYSDDEALDNDEAAVTPNTPAGKASTKAKAQNMYVVIKREAEK
ncbi:hypothetical protein BDR22DRAFT_816479 [Usnea florida]